MNEIEFLYENFFLFKGLDKKKIDKLINQNGIEKKKYLSGDLMLSNTTSSQIGIITKGKAIIKSGSDGAIIKKLGSFDLFGVASLFDEPSHLTYVQAITDCEVIAMSKEFVTNCILEEKTVSLNYIELLAKKIGFLNAKINAYTAKSAENKLYTYLLQQPRTDNYVELNQDMSLIAKMLGIGRATLYRAFDKLVNSGIITKKDKFIIFNEV